MTENLSKLLNYVKSLNPEFGYTENDVNPQETYFMNLPQARLGQVGINCTEFIKPITTYITPGVDEPLLVGRLVMVNVDTNKYTSVSDVTKVQKIAGFIISIQDSSEIGFSPTGAVITEGNVANILSALSPMKSITTYVMQGETLPANVLNGYQQIYQKRENGLLYAFNAKPTNSTGNTYINTGYMVDPKATFLREMDTSQKLNPLEIFCNIIGYTANN